MMVTPHLKSVLKTYQHSATKSLQGPASCIYLNSAPNPASASPLAAHSASTIKAPNGSASNGIAIGDEAAEGSTRPSSNPPPPLVPPPILTPADTTTAGNNQLMETSLGGDSNSISCFCVGGEKRLCLPQVLQSVLGEFTLAQIHHQCDRLFIYCSRCTHEQLNVLKSKGVLPISAFSCGLITQTDAERLCNALLQQGSAPPQPPPAATADAHRRRVEGRSFLVHHECFGRARGQCWPDLYRNKNARCIQCADCDAWFTPQQFVTHAHRGVAAKGSDACCADDWDDSEQEEDSHHTVHWGFDSAQNWRAYLLVGSAPSAAAAAATGQNGDQCSSDDDFPLSDDDLDGLDEWRKLLDRMKEQYDGRLSFDVGAPMPPTPPPMPPPPPPPPPLSDVLNRSSSPALKQPHMSLKRKLLYHQQQTAGSKAITSSSVMLKKAKMGSNLSDEFASSFYSQHHHIAASIPSLATFPSPKAKQSTTLVLNRLEQQYSYLPTSTTSVLNHHHHALIHSPSSIGGPPTLSAKMTTPPPKKQRFYRQHQQDKDEERARLAEARTRFVKREEELDMSAIAGGARVSALTDSDCHLLIFDKLDSLLEDHDEMSGRELLHSLRIQYESLLAERQRILVELERQTKKLMLVECIKQDGKAEVIVKVKKEEQDASDDEPEGEEEESADAAPVCVSRVPPTADPAASGTASSSPAMTITSNGHPDGQDDAQIDQTIESGTPEDETQETHGDEVVDSGSVGCLDQEMSSDGRGAESSVREQ